MLNIHRPPTFMSARPLECVCLTAPLAMQAILLAHEPKALEVNVKPGMRYQYRSLDI